jgi:glycosyltransferase involved in cell wall biosynthesis
VINNHVEGTKFLWLTNLPAPYRLPIWDSIGKRGSLKVLFSMKEQNYRNWNIKDKTAFTFEFLSKPSLRFGELDLIFGVSGTSDSIKCADVVFVGGWDSFFYINALKYSRKIKKPTILFYESTRASHRFSGFFVRKLRSWVFSLADHVVTVGHESTRAALDIGVPSSKILTLFNPVDVAWFADFASENRVTDETGHHFLYVGQLIARKNVKTLIDAFSKICEPDDRLTIVGDGPLAEELKSHTREIGLDGVVEFTGNKTQEQVGLEYARANTLILPSTKEVWGLVVNEALACGLHVVVSRAAGVAEFVEPMGGAFITDPEVDQMAKALESSRAQWSGPIPSPEIMAFTPEKFADAISVLAEDLCRKL